MISGSKIVESRSWCCSGCGRTVSVSRHAGAHALGRHRRLHAGGDRKRQRTDRRRVNVATARYDSRIGKHNGKKGGIAAALGSLTTDH